MKRIIIAITLAALSIGAYADHHGGNSCCADKEACQADACSTDRTIVADYLVKLREAYLSQDLGFLMSILDIDQSTLNDLYNEFMGDDVDKAEIADLDIAPIAGQEHALSSSFTLIRKGYNFSDNKHVTLSWDTSDPNHPKITDVTFKNL